MCAGNYFICRNIQSNVSHSQSALSRHNFVTGKAILRGPTQDLEAMICACMYHLMSIDHVNWIQEEEASSKQGNKEYARVSIPRTDCWIGATLLNVMCYWFYYFPCLQLSWHFLNPPNSMFAPSDYLCNLPENHWHFIQKKSYLKDIPGSNIIFTLAVKYSYTIASWLFIYVCGINCVSLTSFS